MNEERQDYIDELKTKNDPIEQWPLKKLKKEAESGEDERGQSLVIDDIGIE